jgi:molybdopterin/thiamine biosynthesis adenylyltransferase
MSDLERVLRGYGPSDPTSWQPSIFDPGLGPERAMLVHLLESGEVLYVHDEIRAQLAELLEIRTPDRRFGVTELEGATRELMAGRPTQDYGRWIHYPWSCRLVHVLPPDEYREVRCSRNRNKITASEQARLAALRVAIAGLSVGQSTAITLALEGVGGHFRLADFDALNLSNMNRLRAGAHAIGVNKAILTAREIFEIDPYVTVELFPEGVIDDNLERFLVGGGRIDLLFEECDDLKMKIRLRERARHHGIPVLMETSDRGMFDVERFDREPTRALLHGLIGNLRAEELEGLSTYEKVPVVLRMLGAETMSRRMAASLVEIEASIRTWPQLASAVALGGAINADAARRIVLGDFRQSGRFFVDLEQLVFDGRQAAIAPADTSPPPEPFEAPKPQPLVAAAIRGSSPSASELTTMVSWATLAPSGGNSQPWRFVYRNGVLDCLHDVARSGSLVDFGHSGSYVALGAAVENLSLVAGHLGWATAIDPFPEATIPELVCRVHFGAGGIDERDLMLQIPPRATNRRLGVRQPLDPEDVRALQRAAGDDARLQITDNDDALREIGELLGRTDRLRFLSPVMHRDMMAEMRWGPQDVRRTRDGIDVATLELSAADRAGLELLSSWPVLETLGRLGGGAGLERSSRKSVAAASAVGLVTVEGVSAGDYFRGGRLLERIWLTATARHLAFQPMTVLIFLFARVERGRGEGLSDAEIAEVKTLRGRFRALFEVDANRAEVLLFRIGRAAPPSARSLRRPVEEVLRVEPS